MSRSGGAFERAHSPTTLRALSEGTEQAAALLNHSELDEETRACPPRRSTCARRPFELVDSVEILAFVPNAAVTCEPGKGPEMICRVWRGWSTPQNAETYQHIVRSSVIPAIEARHITGFRHIDLMRRDLETEVEFQTLMWFDSIEAIIAFVGEDFSVSHVPKEARAVLKRFDDHAVHYEVIDRRQQ